MVQKNDKSLAKEVKYGKIKLTCSIPAFTNAPHRLDNWLESTLYLFKFKRHCGALIGVCGEAPFLCRWLAVKSCSSLRYSRLKPATSTTLHSFAKGCSLNLHLHEYSMKWLCLLPSYIKKVGRRYFVHLPTSQADLAVLWDYSVLWIFARQFPQCQGDISLKVVYIRP